MHTADPAHLEPSSTAAAIPDRAAELLLVHLHSAHLLALRISGSEAFAEDIVQEAFARALPAARRQPPQDARTWLLRITANVAKNLLRTNRTQQRIKAQMQQ